MKFTTAAIIAFAALSHAAALPAVAAAPAAAAPAAAADAPPAKAANGDNAVIEPATREVFSGTIQNGVMTAKPDSSVTKRDEEDLEKRVLPILILAGNTAVTVAVTTVVTEAAVYAANIIKYLPSWNAVRERFTKECTNKMWAKNRNYWAWPAAICYNKGYGLLDSKRINSFEKFRLKRGNLYTDYDCMYMSRNNSFYTWSDGGYINLAYVYAKSCKMDNSGDLHCSL
ncbi:hypothetical protein DSL72_000681 [Monilinia vaccinii-corymbosi]|uniref:DUF7888 domain-containing protein n=1 Tax=Monilinia vaccinii-corymbosi TaxID=61207 RepID=A0A8A3P8P5_9HELO|nr:hypothetical protein DSL72_000681 [Monilinia vaccinii-corymbosi]